MDSICFSVSVGRLGANCKCQKIQNHGKGLSQTSPQLCIFLFFLPLCSRGKQGRGPSGQKNHIIYEALHAITGVCMCVMNPKRGLSIPRSPSNMFLTVTDMLGSIQNGLTTKRRIYQFMQRILGNLQRRQQRCNIHTLDTFCT